jgi:hypothetical protein
VSIDAICPAAVAMGAPTGAGTAAITVGASNIRTSKPLPMDFMPNLLCSRTQHH